MRKKGFTLAELLGVLVIIALLLILIIPGVINRLSSSGDKAKETENEIIYNAADQYIREHPEDYPPGKSGRYCITIQSLIDDGKLAEPVTDVNTGEDLSDKSVMVTIYSTGNTDHEIKEGAECEEIAALPMIDFIVEPNGSSWVKQRKVTIVYPKVDGDYEASHRIDRGSWIRDSSADDGGNIEIVFTKISELEARLKGNNIISSKIDIINVDSEIPVITKVAMGSWSSGLNRVNITAKDNVSGINGLFISTSNVRPSETDSGWISVSSNPGESKTFVRNLDLGTYYVWVKDKAGNISANGTSIKVADTTKPTCSIKDTGTKGSNNWYKSNVNLTMTTSDKESGVASYGMNTSNGAVYNGTTKMTLTYDTKSQTYYGFVRDRAGNVGTCSKNVKRDTVAPSCTVNVSNNNLGENGWYKGNVSLSLSENDATSGVVSRGLTTSSSTSYNGSRSATQTADTSGTTYYGYVKDDAGNTSSCSKTVKKDTVAPTCSLSINGTMGNSSWYRSNVTLSLSRNDDRSGVAAYGISTSTSAIYNGNASYTHTSDIKSVTYYGYVKDAAGNTCKQSKKFKKDATKPSTPYCKKINKGYLTQISSNCNGTRNCSTIFSYGGSGIWWWSTEVVEGDNISGLKDIQQYLKSTNPYSSSCNWISKSSCNVTASRQVYPSTADNKYRSIDNAGNVSAVAECDIEIRRG